MLNEFKRVCKKYNLKYFAFCGTLLGAVRHKGFIPWDDDIDICMPRADYDLLTKVYFNEFSHPYFMQTPYSDKNYAYSFAKLRNINTCFASASFIECPMNQGVFIDIFPLDETTIEGCNERAEKIINILKYCSAYMSKDNKCIKNKHSEFALKTTFSPGDNIKFYEEIQKIAMSKSGPESTHFSCEVCTFYSSEKRIWPKEFFSECMDLPFCNTTIRVPKYFDEVLKVTYNDYMQLPPIDSRGAWHIGVIKNLDEKFDVVRKNILEDMYKTTCVK